MNYVLIVLVGDRVCSEGFERLQNIRTVQAELDSADCFFCFEARGPNTKLKSVIRYDSGEIGSGICWPDCFSTDLSKICYPDIDNSG